MRSADEMLRDVGKPTVPEVLPLAVALYMRDGGGAGCCLHILLDDDNLEDKSADFCVKTARKSGHKDCLVLATILSRMSWTQRRKIVAMRRALEWAGPIPLPEEPA